MGSNATLYEVQGPHGTVYVFALHEPVSGMVWTERSEQAARSMAREKGLTITRQDTLTRSQLLQLMGQEQPKERTPARADPAAPPGKAAKQFMPLASTTQSFGLSNTWAGCTVTGGGAALPLTNEDGDRIESAPPAQEDEIVVSQASTAKSSIFCNENPRAAKSDLVEGANDDPDDEPAQPRFRNIPLDS